MQLLILITFSYAAGIIFGVHNSFSPWIWAAGGIIFGLLSLGGKRNQKIFMALLCITVFCTSVLLFETDRWVYRKNTLIQYLEQRDDSWQLEKIWGTVTYARPFGEDGLRVVLETDSIRQKGGNHLPISGRVQISLYGDRRFDMKYGERWAVEGWMKSARELRPGQGLYIRLQGIHARMYPAREVDPKLVGSGSTPKLMLAGDRLRSRFSETLHKWVDAPYSGVLARMLLGKGEELDPEISETFRRAGLAHVLVVSGMHVTILLTTFLLLSVLWNRRPLISFVMLSFALILYYAVTGGGPSVTRATIMGFVFLAALLFGSDYKAKTSLFYAALLMMIMDPLIIFHPGAQMTFCASAGVIFIYPEFALRMQGQRIHHRLIRIFFLSLSAQLPLYPIIAYHFNQISIASPVSNLLVVPIIGFILPMDLVTCIAGLIPGPVAAAPAFLAEMGIRVVVFLAEFFAKLPFSNIIVPTPAIWWIVLYEVFIGTMTGILVLFRKGKDSQIIMALAVAAAMAVIISFPSILFHGKPGINVFFIDVGEGDSALVEVPAGRLGRKFRILVDAGGSWGESEEFYDPGEAAVGAFLRSMGVSRLDAVVLSHAEADHMNGFEWVLNNVRVDRFIDVGTPAESVCRKMENIDNCSRIIEAGRSSELSENQLIKYERLLDIVKEKGIEYIPAIAGISFKLDSGARIKVLSPDVGLLISDIHGHSEMNHTSIVLQVNYGDANVLLTGDIDRDVEERLCRHQPDDIAADILKAPHHGSFTSSSYEFISRVNPEQVIFSTSGRYGHPHTEVVKRYEASGANLWTTRDQGTISCFVSTRGKSRCMPEYSGRLF